MSCAVGGAVAGKDHMIKNSDTLLVGCKEFVGGRIAFIAGLGIFRHGHNGCRDTSSVSQELLHFQSLRSGAIGNCLPLGSMNS